jgi:hypothetical protein
VKHNAADEYEYRVAEYEYECRVAEYEYEYREAEYEYECRNAEYEYEKVKEPESRNAPKNAAQFLLSSWRVRCYHSPRLPNFALVASPKARLARSSSSRIVSVGLPAVPRAAAMTVWHSLLSIIRAASSRCC